MEAYNLVKHLIHEFYSIEDPSNFGFNETFVDKALHVKIEDHYQLQGRDFKPKCQEEINYSPDSVKHKICHFKVCICLDFIIIYYSLTIFKFFALKPPFWN